MDVGGVVEKNNAQHFEVYHILTLCRPMMEETGRPNGSGDRNRHSQSQCVPFCKPRPSTIEMKRSPNIHPEKKVKIDSLVARPTQE
jgi:hypothetical protein